MEHYNCPECEKDHPNRDMVNTRLGRMCAWCAEDLTAYTITQDKADNTLPTCPDINTME